MPNIVENVVRVLGSKEHQRKFYFHMGDKFDLEKITPMPKACYQGNLGEEQRRMCVEKGIPNWYDWSRANWGTKWNTWEHRCVFKETETHGTLIYLLEYYFHTAWAPPYIALRQLRKDWPQLTFFGECQIEGDEEYDF